MIGILRNSIVACILITALYLVLFYPLVLINRFGWDDLLLVALSITPGIFIMVSIYNLDRYDKEPLWLLALAFILGAIILYLDIDILEYIFSHVNSENKLIRIGQESMITSLIEEFLKFLVVFLIIFPNKHFDEPFDGIVYSVFVAMGFATAENLTFVMQSTTSTAFLRMISAIPAHFVFAVMMGFYLGKAKTHKTALYVSLALIIPFIFHSFYDYFLFMNFVPGLWVGGIITLVLAIYISKNSIIAHLQASPFKQDQAENQQSE